MEDELREEIKILRSALEFYANPKVWEKEDIGSMARPQMWKEIDRDNGEVAREALRKADQILNDI